MDSYQNHFQNLTDYMNFIWDLEKQRMRLEGAPSEELRESFYQRLEEILARERNTPAEILLTVPYLRNLFHLDLTAFILMITALALELDGGLRTAYTMHHGKNIPDFQFGLLLLELLVPIDGDIFSSAFMEAEWALCLFRSDLETGYLLERPLQLIRGAAGFLVSGKVGERSFQKLYIAKQEPFFPLYQETLEKLVSLLSFERKTLVILHGREGSGRKSLVKAAVNCLGGSAVFLALGKMDKPGTAAFENQVRELIFIAALYRGFICVVDAATGQDWMLEALLERVQIFSFSVLLLVGSGSWEKASSAAWGEGYIKAYLHLPEALEGADSEIVWNALSPDSVVYSPKEMAERYRFNVGDVQRITEEAAIYAGLERRPVTEKDIAKAVRERNRLPECGSILPEGVPLVEMVLSAESRRQLLHICGMVRHRAELREEWGIRESVSSAGGVTALFHGPSGTGKTMAASALARELGMPLLRADLSSVMDKYIGETEKHLERLFGYASENNCVLFFDEADALFGKRTAMESAHDKYANVSTSYLLQRLERHNGVVLLATNFIHNFDDAFLRRIHCMIKFPMPDAPLREKLWKQSFSLADRIAPDVDFTLLASADLSPARIVETARSAAVLAICEGDTKITMNRIVQAIQMEQEKGGKLLPSALQGYLKKSP